MVEGLKREVRQEAAVVMLEREGEPMNPRPRWATGVSVTSWWSILKAFHLEREVRALG